jgi:hypothetical protein
MILWLVEQWKTVIIFNRNVIITSVFKWLKYLSQTRNFPSLACVFLMDKSQKSPLRFLKILRGYLGFTIWIYLGCIIIFFLVCCFYAQSIVVFNI